MLLYLTAISWLYRTCFECKSIRCIACRDRLMRTSSKNDQCCYIYVWKWPGNGPSWKSQSSAHVWTVDLNRDGKTHVKNRQKNALASGSLAPGRNFQLSFIRHVWRVLIHELTWPISRRVRCGLPSELTTRENNLAGGGILDCSTAGWRMSRRLIYPLISAFSMKRPKLNF